MQGCIKFVGIVGDVLLEIEYAAVELTHVLDYRLRHKTASYEVLKQTLGYPLRILDITLATGELLDEVRVYKLEFHRVAKLVPHRHPVDRRAFHSGFCYSSIQHVLTHLTEVRGQHSVGLFKNNRLVMTHNTKINTIFMHVKAGDRSVPVHIIEFRNFPPNY